MQATSKIVSSDQPASDATLNELAVYFMDDFGASATAATLAVSAVDLASSIVRVSNRHVEEVAAIISDALGVRPTYKEDLVYYEWKGLMMTRKKGAGLEFLVTYGTQLGPRRSRS